MLWVCAYVAVTEEEKEKKKTKKKIREQVEEEEEEDEEERRKRNKEERRRRMRSTISTYTIIVHCIWPPFRKVCCLEIQNFFQEIFAELGRKHRERVHPRG